MDSYNPIEDCASDLRYIIRLLQDHVSERYAPNIRIIVITSLPVGNRLMQE
ncbi:hypothetical protein IWW55_000284 [Coemansia sp. RSA 2706]|nr:hypothetical protein IWW55_000284 [Coemansia sp. RSA 2706]